MRLEKVSGKKIWNKVKEVFITDQVFIENEYRTNMFVSKVLALMALILVVSWLFNEVGIYDINIRLMRMITLQGFFELVIPMLVCIYYKGKKPWIKYLMMLLFVVVMARFDSLLTYSVIPVMFIPVALSCCYYSGVFTAQIAFLTEILFGVSAFCGAYFGIGLEDLNFPAASKGEYVYNIMMRSYVPKLVLFVLISFICYEIAVRCKRMVVDQHNISQKQTRVETELALASKIQVEALPSTSSLPRQDAKTFDLDAMMVSAKEVGGDFYDFFFLDPTHLVLMIADVSGKGVPAALYMMVSKILLDLSFDDDRSPGKVLTEVNHVLAERGLGEMFVTVWLGVLDLTNGELVSASAGHEYPMIYRNGEAFSVFKDKHGLVLGGMDGIRYKETTTTLAPGDILFVYTDGVVEANDSEYHQFGIENTLKSLNKNKDKTMAELLANVKEDIDKFVKGAPQFDDITMLGLKYLDHLHNEGITVHPSMDTFPEVMNYVESELEKADIPLKQSHKVCLVADELLANIVNYSGAEWVQVICRISDEKVILYIRDNGVPFNPLERKDPDIEASVEERDIGGLGIFLSKKMMDDMSYRYVNGINVVCCEMKR